MLTLKSSAFSEGQVIPTKYTCDGEDISPPLEWDGIPDSTRSLVLIVDDPDAPDPKAPTTVFVHWIVYDIAPDISSLPEGASAGNLPAPTQEGTNDWRRNSYGGPCPPRGRHRYFFKLYALDTMLGNIKKPTKAGVEAAMQGHIIAQSQLIGLYQR